MSYGTHDDVLMKIKVTTAHEYAQQYGMSLVEAFVRTAISYAPSNFILSFDFIEFEKQRLIQNEEERWIFDLETIDGLKSIFKNDLHLVYPESVLTHMFPDNVACEMILSRVAQNVAVRSEHS